MKERDKWLALVRDYEFGVSLLSRCAESKKIEAMGESVAARDGVCIK